MGFLDEFARDFPKHDVVIVRNAGKSDESRTPSRAIVQSKSGQFEVETPIYEGDVVEVADPRGGVRELYVAEVNVTDVGNLPGEFSGMSHISVKWGSSPQPVQPNNVFHISGGTNQLAWDNRTATQTQSIGGDLRAALSDILTSAKEQLPDGEDRALIEDAAAEAMASLDRGEPAPRRAIAAIKGVLGEVANGVGRGLGAAAAGWAAAALASLN